MNPIKWWRRYNQYVERSHGLDTAISSMEVQLAHLKLMSVLAKEKGYVSKLDYIAGRIKSIEYWLDELRKVYDCTYMEKEK